MSSPDGPFVGLDYFREEDAGLFFGREGERKQIIGNLRASRLTLLYSESGVGKSSLLRAGVAARIRELAARSAAVEGSARYVPVVFNSWQGDPTAGLIAALEDAARPLLADKQELALDTDALEPAIEHVARTVEATPLLILDQFEEHFLYEPGEEFDDQLARCVNRRDLRAHFLISIREDAYSLIGSRFKARIPNVYGNFLHLEFLEEKAAHEAVVGPVHAFNDRLAADAPRFGVEPGLAKTVLDQVQRGRVTMGDRGALGLDKASLTRIETAYLQLVMKRLWDEEVQAGSHQLRLETLNRLGGANTIVHGHLEDVMGKLPADQRDAAAAAFRFLVTSTGRKIALSTEELREFSDADEAALVPALEHLKRERILRPLPSPEPGGVARHEIYHDVLAPAIREWRRAETDRRLEQARRRARHLEVRTRRLAAAVVALAALAIGLALYLWNPKPVQRLELGTIDTRFAVRGDRAPDPRLAVIAVDDRTLRQFGASRTGLLPRVQYARMLDRLRQDRPAVIALDVRFESARPGDKALLAAMRATRERLVLAYKAFIAGPDANGRQVIYAGLFGDETIVPDIGVRTGYAGFPQDVDDRHRRADYTVDLVRLNEGEAATSAESSTAETFAFAAADIARGGALRRRVDELPTASRRAWGGQSEDTTWIDYAGPPGTVRRISALDLLDGHVRPGAFRDKLVVIGVYSRSNPDHLASPVDNGREMPGAEMQANAIATMVHDEPLGDASSLINVLAIVLLACLGATAGLIRSIPRAAAAIGVTALVFVAAAQLAFHQGRIVAVVTPLVALVVAAAGVAGMSATRAVRRRRARADQIRPPSASLQ